MTAKCDTIFDLWSLTRLRESQVKNDRRQRDQRHTANPHAQAQDLKQSSG